MDNSTTNSSSDLIDATADIVSSYLQRNLVGPSEVRTLIATVHSALNALTQAAPAAPGAPPLTPAVPIKKSITPDYLICLEDGKQFKSLRRHLSVHFDLSPEEYRTKWGLPAEYPMVAPNYAKVRSALAKQAGLGRKQPAATPQSRKAKRVTVARRAKERAPLRASR